MNALNAQLRELEARFERLIVAHQALKTQVAALNNQLHSLAGQGGNQPGGGGAACYSMVGVVITAGSSVTGATVNVLIAGTATPIDTNATVYNQMQVDTVVTNTLMLNLNPDGSYSAVSQSC